MSRHGACNFSHRWSSTHGARSRHPRRWPTGRLAELDLTTDTDCGEAAAAIADEHGVRGSLFSFKVDGVEVNRYAPAAGIAPDACVELIEVPLATGGLVDGSTMTLVGEQGPELTEDPAAE